MYMRTRLYSSISDISCMYTGEVGIFGEEKSYSVAFRTVTAYTDIYFIKRSEVFKFFPKSVLRLLRMNAQARYAHIHIHMHIGF